MAKEAQKTTSKEVTARPEVIPARAPSPFEEMDRLFESFFPRGWMRPFRWERPSFGEMMAPIEGRVPRVDVLDQDEKIVVRAEVPGVEKKDLEISTTENTVTIRGTTHREEKEEKGDYYRCEIARGEFSRTVALPGEIDGTKAKATFKDGMLELALPKVAKSKRHTIKVE
jgi:HSP20 family protein